MDKAWNSPAEYPSWVARCDIKGSDGTMLNPIYWMKVQGQKHPGRWGIVEHQMPSIKVLFKRSAKSHKHPGIKLLSSESKTQLVNQRKQNSYRNIEVAYIYIYIYKQSFWTIDDIGTNRHTGIGLQMDTNFRSFFVQCVAIAMLWCVLIHWSFVTEICVREHQHW